MKDIQIRRLRRYSEFNKTFQRKAINRTSQIISDWLICLLIIQVLIRTNRLNDRLL